MLNKLAIPAILAATVMVAGIFAFMPVEQASTVHTSNSMTLADDAITAAKIADNAITEDQISANAVAEITNALSVISGSTDGGTTMTITPSGTTTNTYTLTTDTTVFLWEIQIVANMSGTGTSENADTLAVTAFEMSISDQNNATFDLDDDSLLLTLDVTIGDAGAEEFLSLLNEYSANNPGSPLTPIVITPEMFIRISLELDDGGAAAAAGTVPVLVTFFTEGPNSATITITKS